MRKNTLLALLVLAIAGCTSYKSVPYLQDIDLVNANTDSLPLFDARIMPKDLLSITVNTTDPASAAPFNLTIQTPLNASLSTVTSTSQPSLQQYLVDNNGEIEFPVIGTLKVGGLSKKEAEELIKEKLQPYLKETPIVTVRMANYKISVIGEVSKPGTFTVSNEKVNIFEALAMAGDMTVYGVRDSVKLLREDAQGHRQIHVLNLNSSATMLSPYYYLQQNDIVYVTPNKAKARNSDIGSSTTILISITSILISLATLIVNIVN